MMQTSGSKSLRAPGSPAWLIFLALGFLLGGCSRSSPEVVAAGETLQGEWTGKDDAVAMFLGIPYAAPPVGDLRWRAPAAASPRAGAQESTTFPPACVQGPQRVDAYVERASRLDAEPDATATPQSFSEDCLYLNIWTPGLAPKEKLPVMVFVHGGGNRVGWSYEPDYLGERLAARGVVVVSIAYRLGPLGFFAHPALANGAGEPVANFGLLDIKQAFLWVRQNIGAFGGDPDNITGFGESAGAADLLALALSGPDSDGLFDRIIAQSAPDILSGLPTLAQGQAAGQALGVALGLAATATAAELRAIPAQQLVDHASADSAVYDSDPLVDGLTIDKQPGESLRQGRGKNLELLIGTNADPAPMVDSPMFTGAAIGPEQVKEWIEKTAPEYAGSLLGEVELEGDARQSMNRLHTALSMLCPSRFIAATVSSQGGQGFVYYFSRPAPGGGSESIAAYQGAELPYVFDHALEEPGNQDEIPELTGAVMDYWTSFARNGNPRATNQPGWPVFTASRQYVMQLGDKVGVMEPHDKTLCRYLGPRQN